MSLIGHAKAVRQVERGLEDGCCAFLVVGEHGSLKNTFVHHIAEGVFGSLDHPDLLEYTSEGTFTVKLAREVVKDVVENLPGSDFKLVVIHSAEKLNADAADVLLKTLEEGTGRTRFLLTASSLASVRPTIRSRCEIVYLYRMSDEDIVKVLESEDIDPDPMYLKIGRGLPGRAIRAAVGSLEAVHNQAISVVERVMTCDLWDIDGLYAIVRKDLLPDLILEMMAVLVRQEVDLERFRGYAWVFMEELAELYRVSGNVPLEHHLAITLVRARRRVLAYLRAAA